MVKLIHYEFKKIVKNKGLLLLLLLLFFLHILFSLWQIYFDIGRGYSAIEEKKFFEYIEQGEGSKECLKLIDSSRRDLYQIARIGEEGQEFSEKWREYNFYLIELNALKNVELYSEKIQELSEQNLGLMNTALGENNNYLSKYQKKIQEMYSKIETLKITLKPSMSIILLVEKSLGDFILLFALMIIVLHVVFREKKDGTDCLILYTKRGYKGIFWAKLFTVNSISIFLYLLFSLQKIIIVFFTIGIPRWDTLLPCLKEFYYCPYDMSVGDLIRDSWIWRLCAFLLFSNILFMFVSYFRQILTIFLAEIFFLIFHMFAWFNISNGMWCGFLREISICAFLSPGHYYEQANYINVFQTPIEIKWIGGFFLLFQIISAFMISYIIWKTEKNQKYLKKRNREKLKKNGNFRNKILNAKLDWYEDKRLWIICNAGIMLLIMAAVQFIICNKEELYSEQELYYKEYCKIMDEFTSIEINQYLMKEQKEFDERKRILNDYYNQFLNGEISNEAFAALSKKYEIPEAKQLAFDQIVLQYETASVRNDSQKNLRLLDENGWSKIFAKKGMIDMGRDLLFFLTGAILCISQYECMEFQYQLQPLIITKRNGDKPYRKEKMNSCIKWGISAIGMLFFIRLSAVLRSMEIGNPNIFFSKMANITFTYYIFDNIPIALMLLFFLIFEVVFGALLAYLIAFIAERVKNVVNSILATGIFVFFSFAFIYIYFVL